MAKPVYKKQLEDKIAAGIRNGEHWNIPMWADTAEELAKNPDVKPHTYVQHCHRKLPVMEYLAQIMSEPPPKERVYTNEMAVLEPERLYLHYLIAKLVCRVSIENKEDFLQKVQQLHDNSIADVRKELEQRMPVIEERLQRMFDEYIKHYALEGNHKGKMPPNTQHESDLLEYFEKARSRVWKYFDLKEGHKEDQKYLDASRIFRALCRDEVRRFARADLAKEMARKTLDQVMKDPRMRKQYPPLILKPPEDCHHIVIGGGMATGKSLYFEHKGFKRKEYAFVDLDEFKECELISEKSKDLAEHGIKNGGDGNEGKSNPMGLTWNKRAHDECYLIREKVLDELEEMTRKRKMPDVFVQTTLMSDRLYNVLCSGNAKVDAHIFYSDPEVALKNSYDRQIRHEGRRVSTQAVLESLRNLADKLDKVLERPSDGRRFHLTLYKSTIENRNKPNSGLKYSKILEKFPDMRLSGNQPAQHTIKPEVKVEPGELRILDCDAFQHMHKCLGINVEAKSSKTCYEAFEHGPVAQEIRDKIRKLLKKHFVTFYHPLPRERLNTDVEDRHASPGDTFVGRIFTSRPALTIVAAKPHDTAETNAGKFTLSRKCPESVAHCIRAWTSGEATKVDTIVERQAIPVDPKNESIIGFNVDPNLEIGRDPEREKKNGSGPGGLGGTLR